MLGTTAVAACQSEAWIGAAGGVFVLKSTLSDKYLIIKWKQGTLCSALMSETWTTEPTKKKKHFNTTYHIYADSSWL